MKFISISVHDHVYTTHQPVMVAIPVKGQCICEVVLPHGGCLRSRGSCRALTWSAGVQSIEFSEESGTMTAAETGRASRQRFVRTR